VNGLLVGIAGHFLLVRLNDTDLLLGAPADTDLSMKDWFVVSLMLR
jgi:hypothetical protein